MHAELEEQLTCPSKHGGAAALGSGASDSGQVPAGVALFARAQQGVVQPLQLRHGAAGLRAGPGKVAKVRVAPDVSVPFF